MNTNEGSTKPSNGIIKDNMNDKAVITSQLQCPIKIKSMVLKETYLLSLLVLSLIDKPVFDL